MVTFFVWGTVMMVGALAAGLLCRSPKSLVISLPVTFILGGVLGWAATPTLNVAFIAPYFFFGLGYLIGAVNGAAVNTSSYEDDGQSKVGIPAGIGALAFVGLSLFGCATTDGMFHAQEYHALLGTPQAAVTFEKDVAAIDTKKLRMVNESYARRIADKMLGEQPGLGSQTDLGTMQIAQLNGCFDAAGVGAQAAAKVCFEHELVWVAPLIHGGFFRWSSNGATHEYALVSASDPERKLLVHQVGGQPLNLKYHAQGAHFGDYLLRHIREHGYLSQGLMDINFELDDAGRPWWVAVTVEKRIGLSGLDATGVLVIDPATGAITRYALKDVPQWVDRVQPEELVENQFDNWGKFGKGWMNSWTSHVGVVQTSTTDLHLVEGSDGGTYWYTGIASYGNDQSTSGFILVNTKTKETKVYTIPGAMEGAAQASAENMPGVKERGYMAGETILYNLDGVPTYFMTLNGGDSVPRMYAFVSVHDYQIVGAAESISNALNRYQTALRGKGGAAFEQKSLETHQLDGTLVRIAADAAANGWWILATGDGKAVQELFVPAAISPETKYAKEGDKVRFTVETGESNVIGTVVGFDDLELALK